MVGPALACDHVAQRLLFGARSKYGLRWFRKWEIFLAWSTIIAGQGSATCYQLTCHKNLNTFNRRQFWERPLLGKKK